MVLKCIVVGILVCHSTRTVHVSINKCTTTNMTLDMAKKTCLQMDIRRFIPWMVCTEESMVFTGMIVETSTGPKLFISSLPSPVTSTCCMHKCRRHAIRPYVRHPRVPQRCQNPNLVELLLYRSSIANKLDDLGVEATCVQLPFPCTPIYDQYSINSGHALH